MPLPLDPLPLRLPAFFLVPFLLVPREALLPDFLAPVAAFFPDFLPAAFLEPVEPDFLLDFLLERFRPLVVAIYLTLTKPTLPDIYKSNASPSLKKRCLLWTTSVATRAPQEAGSEDPASNMDLKAENFAGLHYRSAATRNQVDNENDERHQQQ